MRKIRMLAVGATALALLLSACQPGDGSSPSPSSGAPSTPAELPTVIVGSADFDESAIVAEIYAQALEAAGFHARVIQHECDHLDGVLFFERMGEADRLSIKADLLALEEQYQPR